MKVAVIGAGITGITTAYYLSKQNHKVKVFDTDKYPGMKCSFANGGQISVSNSEVWTTWSNVIKGVKWMFKKDAPLLIRPSLDLDKIFWLTKFLYHTATNSYERNTLKTIEMGIMSNNLYKEMLKEHPELDFDQRFNGIMHIYKDAKYYDMAIKAKQIYERGGCEWNPLTSSEAKVLEPALGNMDMVGAIYTSTDWTGDIHKFCYNMRNILQSKYGVVFTFDSDDMDIDDIYDYDAIVVCAGVDSKSIAERIGETLPIYPVKGYSITINNVSDVVLPKVSLLDDQAKIVTSALGNRLRVAGTAEFDGKNYDIRRDRIDPLLKWVQNNFPLINTHDYSSWACLRPMTPNMLPIVRQSSTLKKVFYNTGHGHLGWTLAPYTAKRISEVINEQTTI